MCCQQRFGIRPNRALYRLPYGEACAVPHAPQTRLPSARRLMFTSCDIGEATTVQVLRRGVVVSKASEIPTSRNVVTKTMNLYVATDAETHADRSARVHASDPAIHLRGVTCVQQFVPTHRVDWASFHRQVSHTHTHGKRYIQSGIIRIHMLQPQ